MSLNSGIVGSANVQMLNQLAYIRDFDVEVAQAATIGDPIVGRIEEGVVLDVRPIVSADRRYLTLELRPTVASLVRPIPTFSTLLGVANSTPVFIQTPELRIQRALEAHGLRRFQARERFSS